MSSFKSTYLRELQTLPIFEFITSNFAKIKNFPFKQEKWYLLKSKNHCTTKRKQNICQKIRENVGDGFLNSFLLEQV